MSIPPTNPGETSWHLTLAQPGSGPAGTAVVWVLILIGAAIAGGFVIMMVRRKMLEPEGNDIGSEGLFDSLRRMRESGELSQAEYETARRRIIEQATEGKARPAPTTPEQARILAAARASEMGDLTAQARRGAGAREAGESRVAMPGYDLTGAPLPPRKTER